MDEKERTIQILAQAEINHAYTVALLEAAQQREQLLEREREELRQQVGQLEAEPQPEAPGETEGGA